MTYPTPAQRAALDQSGAAVRDAFDTVGVCLGDPETARVVRATVLLCSALNQNQLAFLFTALCEMKVES